jgi:toxin ParE1/3/4
VTAAGLTPRARRDVTAAVRWIRKDNRTAARALRNAVGTAAERIGRHPAIGRVRNELLPEPYRFLSLTGFPYVLVYNCQRDPPLIVALLHTARDLKDALRDISEPPGDPE